MRRIFGHGRYAYQFPLPTATAPANAHFIAFGAAVPPGCAGGTPANPSANPGYLCVFETSAGANTGGRTLESSRFGFVADAASTAGSPATPATYGYTSTWAVTAG